MTLNILKPYGEWGIKLRSKLGNKQYAKIIRRLYFQMLAVFLFAMIIGIGIRTVGRGYIGNWILSIIQDQSNLNWYESAYIYQIYIRNNIEIIVMVTILFFFAILFRISLVWFTKYFDEIVYGVNQLVQENEEKIILSPELDFFEEKLNQVKDKLLERKLKSMEAEKRKNELVVYLAHDIKTPLTSVIGYLNLLDEIPDMPCEQKEKYINITLKKATHLNMLINEFFDITQYNVQNITLDMVQIDLYYMLVQMADEFYPNLVPQGKKIIINADEDLIVYGDPNKLARVFNNIIKNAIAYSYENSNIEVVAKVQEDNIMITFINNGSTIPKEHINSIFRKFYRVDGSRSTATGGAGLGLAIAKEIVILHGGNITVESENSITKFIVSLPVSQNHDVL
ncbi:sensor histidine kinase [Mobilisporobacter senegalensis]|uniref:sensor histidine kinase n=1 Tax=Mobilisporobacter senegalensis TaxID=1329262 RepID=UPI000F4AB228|nr:HAMP domain-containing sensor histidine kinase [Mobilisporobacter senegalensis]